MIRNFTPHDIVFRHDDGTDTVFPSKGSIRIETDSEIVGQTDGFETVRIVPNAEKTILPDQEDGVFFIVSAMVRDAFPQRTDFISPCTDPQFVVRNDKGQVEAVKAWQRG